MTRRPDKEDEDLVKVRFALQPGEWHGSEAEWMWAEPLGLGELRFRLRNVPFYAFGVSFLDEVIVRLTEELVFEFERVAKHSGHSTYRVIVLQAADAESVNSVEAPAKSVDAPVNAAPVSANREETAPQLSDTQKNPVVETADTEENPVVPPPPKRPSGSAPAVNGDDAVRRRKTPQPLQIAQEIAQESAIANAEAALAQVAARVREPRPRPFDVPPDAEFNGELLRKVRQARSLSLQQVAERTRISTRHLENIEADRYDALPATVYLRGILMNIAREYSLDPLRVSKSYLALVPSQKK